MDNHKKPFWKNFLIWRRTRILKSAKVSPPWIPKYRRWVYGLSFIALLFLIIESGLRWNLPAVIHALSLFLDYVVFFAFLFDSLITFYYTFPKSSYFKKNWLDILVFAPILLRGVSIQTGTGLIIIRYVIVLIKVFTRTRKFTNVLRGVRLNTAQTIVISFSSTILLGTILLTFPSATTDGNGASFLDALFTATSATCVTGLIVQDTPVYFSTFGQVVILGLIQLGGLGIMTYSAFVAILFGRFSLGQRKMVQEMLEEEQNIYNMIFYIFKMTMIIEFFGALLLFFRFNFHFTHIGQAIYQSVFHSISAFCNAGFSLFSDSLTQFIDDPVINIVIITLIVLGGFGFLVIFELSAYLRKKRKNLAPHTKLVLIVSLGLILGGFLLFFFLEFDGVLLESPMLSKLWASFFQSVTTRTAGFNTIAIGSLKEVTLTLMIILMFIGASPGSTGGGIKTSTFAVLLLSIKSLIKGEEDIVVFKRTIPSSSIRKALALLVSAIALVSVVFLILLNTEKMGYVSLLFEAVSAFGTVGLSTGITPDLSHPGKLLIILLMFLGRIGPLTLGLALTKEIIKGKVEYPSARIMIG